jgi:hypothetical protein
VVGLTALAVIAAGEGFGEVSPSPHASAVGRHRLVALVRMDSFEVGEHDVSVERVMVVKSGVLDHGVRDSVFVLADELASTARARLFVGHGSHPFSAVGAFERDVDEMDRRRQHFVVVLLGVRGVLERNTVEEGEEHAGERVRADRGIDASFAEIPREELREHGLIDAVSL